MFSNKERDLKNKSYQRLVLEKIAARNQLPFTTIEKIALSQSLSIEKGMKEGIDEIKVSYIGKFKKSKNKAKWKT